MAQLTKRNFVKALTSAMALMAIGSMAKTKAVFAQEAANSEGIMTITSSAFENNGFIPEIYTQELDDISPPLTISNVPKGTVSLVLLVLDPDAPDPAKPLRTYTHWVLYNLPPDLTTLSPGVNIDSIPGAMSGLNGRGEKGYIGPKPPIGTHRYFFDLYALDTKLQFDQPPTALQVLEAMNGHVITEAVLIGKYLLKKNRM